MRSSNHNQDRFFLWVMVLLPILSLCAYIFDACYYYYKSYDTNHSVYEGLFSTILILFSYLQYCAPIESRRLRFAYHFLLWTLSEIGRVAYLLTFIRSNNLFSILIYMGWIILDIVFTSALLYCRVYRKMDHHVEVEHKHIFHFISRLEVILAIFIPVFINPEFSTVTRNSVAFFLLFDFFSEKYEYFNRAWIKSCLYLFVTTVTVSVATEWLYFVLKQHAFEYVTDVAELLAGSLCYLFIIMQFFDFHFKPCSSLDISQELQIVVSDSKPISKRY